MKVCPSQAQRAIFASTAIVEAGLLIRPCSPNTTPSAAPSSVSMVRTDVRLPLAAAETLRMPMPVASLLHDHLLTLLARGGDGLDWSAIGQLAAQDADLGDGSPTAREHRNG